jgi:PRTRC genetic system protein B
MMTNQFKTNVLIAPPDAYAAVFFCPGQAQYSRLKDCMQTDKPISASTYKRSGAEVEIDTGWLQPHVVRCGEGAKGPVVMSYQQPARRQILVHLKGTEPTKLTLPLPGLVLAGVGQSYHIFAIREQEFSPKAQLFYAPFPNVGTNARICFGRNKVPQATPQSMDEVWKLIFDSPFNSDQMQNKSLAENEDVRRMLKRVAKDKPESYPLDDLVSYGNYRSTVTDLWESLTQSH